MAKVRIGQNLKQILANSSGRAQLSRIMGKRSGVAYPVHVGKKTYTVTVGRARTLKEQVAPTEKMKSR